MNCTIAPNCNHLNRYPCSNIAQTCGICYNGYYGVFGNSNTKCISMNSKRKLIDTTTTTSTTTSLSHSTSTTTTNMINKNEITTTSSCLSDDDCHDWEICDITTSVGTTNLTISQCVIPTKKCINECSNHGDCIFINVNTREKIDRSRSSSYNNLCLITDDNCQAKCLCNSNYTGLNCDISHDSMIKNQLLRYQLINSLSSIIKSDDINNNNIITWCISLQSLLHDPYQISIDMLTTIYSILSYIINNAEKLLVNYESLNSILNIADSLTTIQLNHHQ